METFEIRGPDGSIYEIKARSMDEAINAFSSAFPAPDDMPKPPPGVIIHDRDRSYVVGEQGAPSVNTKGMDDAQRDLAARALSRRNTMRLPGLGKVLAPITAGVSASFGDEAISAGYAAKRSLIDGEKFSDAYDLMQEVQRQDLEQRREEAPITSVVSQIGGALTQAPLLAGPLAAAAGMSLAGRMGIGAGVGGALGVVEGAGSGSGFDDRLTKAGIGGAIGAGVGGAVPVLAQGAGSLYRKAADHFTVNNQLKQIGLNRPAGDSLMRALDADDAFSGAGARRILGGGDSAMLADAGPSARAVLDTAMQRGGPATRLATEAVNTRARQANEAVSSTLDRVLGRPQGVETTKEAIRQGTAAARDATYRAAYETPIDYTGTLGRRLEAMMKRVPKSAIDEANKLMRVEGVQSRQILADIADDGSVVFRSLPDVRQWDYITRGLNTVAQSSEGSGALGRKTPLGSAIERLSGEIRNTVKKLVPEYGVALNTSADPIRRIQAVELGQNMLRKSMTRDEVMMQLRGMGAAERAAVKQGIRSQIDEDLANISQLASNPNIEIRQLQEAMKKLTSDASFHKLATLLGAKGARELRNELGKSFKAAELYAATVRNSATFARGAVDSAVNQTLEPGVIGSLTRGKPLNATQRLTQSFFGTSPQDELAIKDEVYRQLSQVLTEPRGQEALVALRRLKDAYEKAPANEELGKLLGAYLGTGTGLAAHHSARQYIEAPKSR